MSDIGPLGLLFAFQTYFVPDSNPIVGKIVKILYFSVALCSLQLEQAHANEINTVLDKDSIEKMLRQFPFVYKDHGRIHVLKCPA